jgi:hypothetical protein
MWLGRLGLLWCAILSLQCRNASPFDGFGLHGIMVEHGASSGSAVVDSSVDAELAASVTAAEASMSDSDAKIAAATKLTLDDDDDDDDAKPSAAPPATAPPADATRPALSDVRDTLQQPEATAGAAPDALAAAVPGGPAKFTLNNDGDDDDAKVWQKHLQEHMPAARTKAVAARTKAAATRPVAPFKLAGFKFQRGGLHFTRHAGHSTETVQHRKQRLMSKVNARLQRALFATAAPVESAAPSPAPQAPGSWAPQPSLSHGRIAAMMAAARVAATLAAVPKAEAAVHAHPFKLVREPGSLRHGFHFTRVDSPDARPTQAPVLEQTQAPALPTPSPTPSPRRHRTVGGGVGDDGTTAPATPESPEAVRLTHGEALVKTFQRKIAQAVVGADFPLASRLGVQLQLVRNEVLRIKQQLKALPPTKEPTKEPTHNEGTFDGPTPVPQRAVVLRTMNAAALARQIKQAENGIVLAANSKQFARVGGLQKQLACLQLQQYDMSHEKQVVDDCGTVATEPTPTPVPPAPSPHPRPPATTLVLAPKPAQQATAAHQQSVGITVSPQYVCPRVFLPQAVAGWGRAEGGLLDGGGGQSHPKEMAAAAKAGFAIWEAVPHFHLTVRPQWALASCFFDVDSCVLRAFSTTDHPSLVSLKSLFLTRLLASLPKRARRASRTGRWRRQGPDCLRADARVGVQRLRLAPGLLHPGQSAWHDAVTLRRWRVPRAPPHAAHAAAEAGGAENAAALGLVDGCGGGVDAVRRRPRDGRAARAWPGQLLRRASGRGWGREGRARGGVLGGAPAGPECAGLRA